MNTGGLPPKAQTQTDEIVTVRDLIDNVLDAMQECKAGIIFTAIVVLLFGRVLWIANSVDEVDYNAEYNARQEARRIQEKIQLYTLGGERTWSEAREAVEVDEAFDNHWRSR